MIFQNFVRAFLKAAGHRYYKRVPYMTPKGKRYRYFYRVTSTHRGRHAFDAEHLVEGTKFALHGEGESEFHGHITAVDGDMIKYVIDDGPRKGEEVTTSRQRLVDELNLVHGVQDKLTAEREKVRGAIAEAKRAGHGGVVRRLERRLRALGGEVEAQPEAPTPKREAEPTEYGTHISEDDIATYKRIAEEGPDVLADMSDDEITRLMLQHGRNVDARSRAVQNEINAARDELKHFELMRELERAEGRLTIHPVRQQDRDEHARLSEEFARVDAEYKRRSEEAQKRHVYTDPVLGRHDDSAHHLTMEHYERKEKREAEEERRTKGSKLYQSLNVENAKGMREKHDAEVRRQRREAPEQRAIGSLSAIAKEFNHEDAYEIAERAIEERPRDALIVADLIQTTPDNANRISTPLTIRLAELIHGEPSPNSYSPRERHLMDIHSTLDTKEQRKKNGTRSNYSKREVSEALDKLREHVRRFYPEDDPTAFAEMRGQIREAIEGVIATYEKSLAEDTKDEARIKRALERLKAISRGEIEAQPTEPEPEAQPTEPVEREAESAEPVEREAEPEAESAAPKPTPRGTGKRKITGKVDDFNRHMTTNPDSVVRKDLIERLGRDDSDIDRAVNVLGDATTTTFERRVGKRKAKIVSLIDGGFADERFDIGIGYSKLDDAVMMFVRRGENADAVGNLLPDLPVRGESEGLAILTLLRDKIDFADLNARTDANDLDSIKALTKEIRDAWSSIPDARDATNKLKVTMEEIARQKDTLALEYHASRPYTQTEDTTTVSPNENALSRGADMSEGDRKKLARAVPADKDRQDLDAQIHDGNIIGRTDGKRIHFMITEDTGDRARYGTQTGELLDDGLVSPPVSKVIPASNPNFTLSKDAIKHVLSVISSFKKKRLADRVFFTHNAQTNEQEIRVSLGAIHERGDQGEVIATIPNMSESPDTIIDMQFLKDALKLAGDSASFTLRGVERPLRIDADSGIHSVIMPKRP
jgi:hypothetical protein